MIPNENSFVDPTIADSMDRDRMMELMGGLRGNWFDRFNKKRSAGGLDPLDPRAEEERWQQSLQNRVVRMQELARVNPDLYNRRMGILERRFGGGDVDRPGGGDSRTIPPQRPEVKNYTDIIRPSAGAQGTRPSAGANLSDSRPKGMPQAIVDPVDIEPNFTNSGFAAVPKTLSTSKEKFGRQKPIYT